MDTSDEAARFSEMSSSQRDAALRLIRDLNPAATLGMHESAFAGILYRCGGLPPVGVYDVEKILQILEDEGEDDPMDVFSYGALRAMPYGGENGEAFAHFSYDDHDDQAVELVEFENAFLALVESASGSGYAYDKKKCVDILAERDRVSTREAEDALARMLSAYEGRNAPAFIELADGYEPFSG